MKKNKSAVIMKSSRIIHHLVTVSKKYVGPLTGFAALLWFLIRVLPKPSRALYPCQKAAFPVAAAFVAWIISSAGSIALFKKGRSLFSNRKYIWASVLVFASMIVLVTSVILAPKVSVYAKKLSSRTAQVLPLKSLIADDQNVVHAVSTVSIVKAKKENAEDLTYLDIEEMVIRAVEDAGGLQDIVSDGDTVIIKPNLVTFKEGVTSTTIQEKVNGITADWRIVKAVSEIVRELNPTGKIFVMEGSAESTQEAFDLMNYNKSSMPEVDGFFCIEASSGGWRDYEAQELQQVRLPAGKKLYPDNQKPYNSPEYYLNKLYYEADVLISVALIKNHESASITGSIKNLCIGATPANIYASSSSSNVRGTINHGSYLHDFIHDFYLCRPADFAILDGLQGLEYGPAAIISGIQSYEECKMNMRLILAGRDLLALDAIEALLATYDPAKIQYMVNLHNDGAGCADPTLIKVVGEKVADERKDFEHIQSTGPKFTDNIPPDFSVSEISLKDDNTLIIQLASQFNIDKIEIAINGSDIEDIYVADFDSLVVNISGIILDEATDLELIAYNKYLDYKESHITNILSVNSGNAIQGKPRIYPTAMNDILYIDGVTESATIQMYDLSGRLMKTENIPGNSRHAINVSDLPAGFYVITLIQGSQQQYLDKVCKL